MRCGRLPRLVLVAVACCSCGAGPPSPSSPDDAAKLRNPVTIGDAGLQVKYATFWRDWMPIVQKPGPDGGSPLRGVIAVIVDNRGPSARLTFTGTFRDLSGGVYPSTATAVDRSTGRNWDGSIPANGQVEIDITLRDGPYLPAKSKVFAVLTWTDQSGRSASLRTPEGVIGATY